MSTTTITTSSTATSISGCGIENWKGDGLCDDQNNVEECEWDGGDCCGPFVNLYYCTACQCLDPNPNVTCNCQSPGSINPECVGSEMCVCTYGYTGKFCDQCIEGYQCTNDGTGEVLDNCTSCVNSAAICHANAYCNEIEEHCTHLNMDVIYIGGDDGLATPSNQVTLLEVGPIGINMKLVWLYSLKLI